MDVRRAGWRWLAAVQLVALVLCGAVTVARFHVWAPIDERAHYAYVQEVAEHGRLPRIDDVVSAQVQAITDGTWPRDSRRDPGTLGLAGRSYEAFQPPLYYLAAVPAFALVPDHRDKVFALRGFDLVLLGVALVLLWRLARSQLPEAPSAALCAALSVLLWPGVLVRVVTVSNLALEMVVASALLLALARVERRRTAAALLTAGLLMGACLLTKLTLVFLLVPFAVVLARGLRDAPRATLLAAAMPGLVVAPWLVSNVVRLGTLTANRAAQAQQTPLLYPRGNDFGVARVPQRLLHLSDGVLPQEWAGQLGVTWVAIAVVVLALTVPLGAVVTVTRGRTLVARLPGLALAAGLVIAIVTAAAAHWDIFLLRYFYAVLPALAVAVAAHVHRSLGARPLAAAIGLQTLLLAALWVDMAGAFYFTDAGRALGI